MKFKHYTLLVAFVLCFVTTTYSQHTTYDIKNGIGISGGIIQFDIITDNFITKAGQGFVGGLSATLDLPHKGYTLSYGMQFSENNLEILGRPTQNSTQNEMIDFKLMTVQLGFYYHLKIISDNLTLDFGPQLQYNGKLELNNKMQEGYFINGSDNLTATDMADISNFNVNGTVGVSAGIGPIKVKAQYIYGFLNTFEKLNNTNPTTDFKGNQSMVVVTAMFSF